MHHFEKLATIQFPLAKRFYKDCGYSLSCGRLEQVYCLRESAHTSAKIIAAVRFVPHPSGHYVLRNLCVAAHRRRSGLARFLMQEALVNMTQSEKSTRFTCCFTCYCYALAHLQEFYSSLGFILLKPANTPEDIAKSYGSYSQQQPELLLMGWI